MTNDFVLMIVAAALAAALAMTADLEPPFSEGPHAELQNQMHDEAPHGPWAWQGGD